MENGVMALILIVELMDTNYKFYSHDRKELRS